MARRSTRGRTRRKRQTPSRDKMWTPKRNRKNTRSVARKFGIAHTTAKKAQYYNLRRAR